MKESHFYEQEELYEEGEQEVLTIRKHWIVYVENFLLHVFGCAIFIASAMYLSSRGAWNGMLGSDASIGSMILVMFVLIFWASFFFFWTKDYFDVWHVTDRHIVAINQKEMFDREEMFLAIDKIQDIQFQKEGLLSMLFGYGTLQVQSAGAEQKFSIQTVSRVEDACRSLIEIRDGAKAVPAAH